MDWLSLDVTPVEVWWKSMQEEKFIDTEEDYIMNPPELHNVGRR